MLSWGGSILSIAVLDGLLVPRAEHQYGGDNEDRERGSPGDEFAGNGGAAVGFLGHGILLET
ncbi:hypothetical protein GCM10027521_50820 [Amycolatopsis cihanbeyliensis]